MIAKNQTHLYLPGYHGACRKPCWARCCSRSASAPRNRRAFLNKEAPFFKAYPFSVEGSIKRNGGRFTHGAKDSSHVEVDGRLVTGMNWESAAGVADAMIRLLSQKQ